jgi:RHS repeat-associated protein
MLLQHRHKNDDSYRYGYQGSEKDDELKGGGNSYTTENRMLDPRIGRWFSIDPVFQPWQSPYTSMDNNPIGLNDPRGRSTKDWIKKPGSSSYSYDSRVTSQRDASHYYPGSTYAGQSVDYSGNGSNGNPPASCGLRAGGAYYENGKFVNFQPDLGEGQPIDPGYSQRPLAEPLDPFAVPQDNPNAIIVNQFHIDEGYSEQINEFWRRRVALENLSNGLKYMTIALFAAPVVAIGVPALGFAAAPVVGFLGSSTTVVGTSGMLTTTTQFGAIMTTSSAVTGSFITYKLAPGLIGGASNFTGQYMTTGNFSDVDYAGVGSATVGPMIFSNPFTSNVSVGIFDAGLDIYGNGKYRIVGGNKPVKHVINDLWWAAYETGTGCAFRKVGTDSPLLENSTDYIMGTMMEFGNNKVEQELK